jgi:hypothetical protein
MADVTKEIALKVVATDATGPALESLEDKLNAAKKRMVELAAAGQQNTEEFIRLQQEAGEFKRTIEGVEQSVDSVAKSGTQGMQLFGEAVTAVTAGFTIATSVTALYGDENEALQKSIMQVQAAMAILQSVTALVALTNKTSALSTTANRIALSLYDKTVKGTTISLKLFKTALAATGIGIIALAAGLAVQNWDKLRKLLGLPPNNTDAIAALEREIALMEARGDMIEKIEAKRKELIALQAQEVSGQEKANKLNEAAVITEQANLRIKTANVALDEKGIEITQQELELLLQQAGYLANVVEESENLETATKTLTLTSQSNFSEIIKKAQELHKEQTNNYYARRALAQSEQEQQAIDAEEAMRLLKLQNDLEKSLIEIKKRDSEEFNNFFRKERDTELNALEYEASQKTLLLQNERATKLAEAALALGDTEDFCEKELEINKLYDDLQITQDEITAEKRKLIKQQQQAENIKQVMVGVNALADLSKASSAAEVERADRAKEDEILALDRQLKDKLITQEFYEQQKAAITDKYDKEAEKYERKQFELNKAAGIANAMVNTYLAATQVLRDTKGGTVARFVAMAATITAGLAQVAVISKQQFRGRTAGKMSATEAISGGGGSSTATPSPTFSNPNTTMLGTDGAALNANQANQPMRAYVVERDIQQTTSRVRRLSEFATLG